MNTKYYIYRGIINDNLIYCDDVEGWGNATKLPEN